MSQPRSPQANFALIQVSLLLGPILFFAVTWYLHAQERMAPCGLPDGLQYGLPVICILAMSTIFVVRRMRAPVTDAQQFQTLTLIGWAAAEGAALLGVLYYWCSNDLSWAVTGILVTFFGAVVLPAKLPQR